jgi:hypothetical protein
VADVRVINNVVLSDPTTPSQIAAVDASGRLSVSLTASSATVTVDTELTAVAALADAVANPTVTSVGVYLSGFNGTTWDRLRTTGTGILQVDTELPTAAALADGAANATTATVGAANIIWNGATWDRQKSAAAALDSTGTGIANAALVGQFDDAATATVTENQFAHVRISTRRALLIEGVASGTVVPVSLASTTVTGTVTVDTELEAAAALADAVANPTTTRISSYLQGYNGTTWDRLRSTTANGLAVDVTRVTGTVTVDTELTAVAALADAVANPTITNIAAYLVGYNGTTWDRVRTANTGRLQVDVVTGGGVETPTNPINLYGTASAIAAGSTSNHDTADFGAATKKVSQVIMGGSTAMKGELQYVDNSVATTIAVFFTQAGMSQSFKPPHRNYWSHTFTANAGADLFRLIRTNLDASEAADVYSTIQYED